MKVDQLAARKINAHSFKNVDSSVFGIMYGPRNSDRVTDVLPVSHLKTNSCSLHTAFDFSERFVSKLPKDTGSRFMSDILYWFLIK